MAAKVELYDNAYGHYELEVYREIRRETYGEDLGQTSWVTIQESLQIPTLLQLTLNSRVLEIGCGSGGYALSVAERVGCWLTGVDINGSGIRNAGLLARRAGLENRVDFQVCDVSKGLPFPENSFQAAFSNDVLCHIDGRGRVLAEIFRVLKRAGYLLFSDALVIGGLISAEEIATRTSIGRYFFAPPGENERLLREAGFEVVSVADTTASAAEISERWLEARRKRETALLNVEGANFDGLQRFLRCVHVLTSQRRMLRYVYLARKK